MTNLTIGWILVALLAVIAFICFRESRRLYRREMQREVALDRAVAHETVTFDADLAKILSDG